MVQQLVAKDGSFKMYAGKSIFLVQIVFKCLKDWNQEVQLHIGAAKLSVA